MFRILWTVWAIDTATENRFQAVHRLRIYLILRDNWHIQILASGADANPGPVGAGSWQHPQHRLASSDAISDAHANVGLARHHAVGPRPELDHAEPLARLQLVAPAHPAHDPAGEDAGDLDHGDAGAVPFQVERAALVDHSGGRLERRHEPSWRADAVHHAAGDRRAIHVH